METTNSSENPQRRVKHGQRPTEPLADWPAEFGAGSAVEAATPVSTDEFMVYGRAGNRRADLEAKLRDALAASMPAPAATSDDAPDLQRISEILHGLPIAPTTAQLDEAAKRIARIESAAAPAPDWFSYDENTDTLTIHGIKYSGELMRDFGHHMPQGQLFELVARQGNGALCVKRVEPATASGDELPPLPDLPRAPVNHTHLGGLFDRVQMHQYAIRYADLARAAVSAATKPTADLSKLTVYGMAKKSVGAPTIQLGDFVRLDDVQSLLATKPAAAQPAWRAWLPAEVEGWQDGFGLHRSNKAPEIICLTVARSEFQLYENEFAFLLDKMLSFVGSPTPAASTTGAAQTAEQVRDQALEQAALAAEKVQDDYSERQGGKWPELRDDAATGAGDCATAIRALKRPTPTHSSEAGDAS